MKQMYERISQMTNYITALHDVQWAYGGKAVPKSTQYGASFWDGKTCIAKFYERRGELWMRPDHINNIP